MFYSQLLLSKKGALGIIWMAAHCHKRLKKDQVQQTNISSSVDKILDDEVHVVTHRILAFLLLGIVRIYSKKVEYLFHDCHEIMNRLRSLKTGKSARAGTGFSQRHYHSITLPKRFELDTFDLGLDQDAMGGKVRSHKQETHADGRMKDCSRSGSFCKDIVPISEAYSTAHTPPRDVFGAHRKEQDLVKPHSNASISLAGVDVLRRARCSLEDCLDRIQLDETEEEQMHNNKLSNEDWRTNIQGPANDVDSDSVVCLSNNRGHSLPSSDIFHGTGFTLEYQLEPMVLDEAEHEQLNDRASNGKASPNLTGQIQEEQMHDNLSDEDLRTNFQGPTNMESDFVVSLSNNRFLSLPSLEILRGIGFGLEDRLEPMVLDEAEKEQLYDRPSNKNTSPNVQGPIQDAEFNFVANQSPKGSNPPESLEIILHEINLSLEHSSNFELLKEAEKRQGHDKSSHEEHAIDEEQTDNLNPQLNFQEGEHHDFTGAVDNIAPVGPELKRSEVIAPESVKFQKPEKFNVSILNPHSKLPADVVTTEVAAVQTPGRKERAKILKKRKALVDVATVVPNKVLKGWIEDDPTDLKRGSKKVALTPLQAWRAHKLFHVPHSFLEPLVAGVSVDLCYLGCQESYAPEMKSAGRDGLQAIATHGAQENIPDIRGHISENSPRQTPDARSPVAEMSTGQTADVRSLVLEKSQEQAPAVRSPVAENAPDQIPIAPGTPVAENYNDQIPIAPGTPVAYLNSLRSHEAETVADSEKWTSSDEQHGLDALFHEETSSYKGDSLEKDACSARTRMTASYLGRKFLHKKRRKDEQVLSLSHILAGKTKKESTIMFYEILVLKTRNCIDVQQETAYCDILLRETPKLRQYLK
ncbi:Rad21/Rec8-like family protein [Perilla frutescens var. hirtella]|uniref:Rad21/Rec8-like family protein n=1 Tax=Perilla frutescens var. hirtella TaxID=608512 RepID=A0AAD4JCK4_PERFH|nr:Rad21/Rec8-like family protein [Perilla frutescens var. hirtella]